MSSPDELARRRYWTEQMDEAYDFMQRLLAYPVEDCGESLCSLPDRAAEAGVLLVLPEGLKLGQFERVFRMRASLVDRVLAVAESMCRHGWLLKVEDAYRSLAVQRQGAHSDFIFHTVLDKVVWELGGGAPSQELLLRRIGVLTATTPKFANHMSGSAIDITVLSRDSREEVDRGGPYLELSELTPMLSPFISAAARRNRERINEMMADHGFLPYSYEFWHYSHGDVDYELVAGSGRAARYGPVHWDGVTGSVTPVADPCAELISLPDIARRLSGCTRATSACPNPRQRVGL